MAIRKREADRSNKPAQVYPMEILSNDRYKGSISDDSDQALKIDELCDRLDCVQRAQVYLHDHIEESEG